MKKIKNEVTNILEETGKEKLKFSNLAKITLNRIPQGGYNVDEMELRLNIHKKLETANGNIELEDAEMNKLQECVKAMTWDFMHEDLISFTRAIEKA